MLEVSIVETFKDKENKPYAYVIKDKTGKERTVTLLQLNKAVKEKKVKVAKINNT